ncbi:Uncharacterised protein [Mycobacteroides abscessus subsp. abscessus]|nr:Uncharacterised protein [Mycobacteroides abscessus subsp. abscessus]
MQRKAIGTCVGVVTDIATHRHQKLVVSRDSAREALAKAVWNGGTSRAELDALRGRRDAAQRELDELNERHKKTKGPE